MIMMLHYGKNKMKEYIIKPCYVRYWGIYNTIEENYIKIGEDYFIFKEKKNAEKVCKLLNSIKE